MRWSGASPRRSIAVLEGVAGPPGNGDSDLDDGTPAVSKIELLFSFTAALGPRSSASCGTSWSRAPAAGARPRSRP